MFSMENTTYDKHTCSIFPADFQTHFNFYSRSVQYDLHILSIISGIFSPLVVSINLLFLRTMRKNPSLHSPPNILLCSLAAADLLCGFISIPLFVGWMSVYKLNQSCIYTTCLVFASFSIHGCSFMTVLLISLERYIALFYHLRYLSIVTVTRTVKILFPCLGYSLLSCLVSGSVFKSSGLFYVATANISTGCAIITVSYIKIIRLVRRHRRQIQAQVRAQHPPNRSCSLRQRKTAITMGLVIGVMLGCYFPLCCVYSVILSYGFNETTIEALLACFVAGLSCSLWNPIIYCWRNLEIRTAVVSQVQEIKTALSWPCFS